MAGTPANLPYAQHPLDACLPNSNPLKHIDYLELEKPQKSVLECQMIHNQEC